MRLSCATRYAAQDYAGVAAEGTELTSITFVANVIFIMPGETFVVALSLAASCKTQLNVYTGLDSSFDAFVICGTSNMLHLCLLLIDALIPDLSICFNLVVGSIRVGCV